MHALFFAILALTSSFALELGPENIRGTCKEIKSEFSAFSKCLNTISDNFCSVEISCISPRLLQVSGRTFNQQGPNCFAAALLGAGIHSSIRGVSVAEFQETMSSSCTEETNPQFGDIGVYYTEGFGATHAYTHLSKSIAFEKQGVDYGEPTPLRFNRYSSIDYTHKASQLCRQFGDESCHAKSTFYRCSKIKLPSNFSKVLTDTNLQITRILNLKEIPPVLIKNLEANQKELAALARSPLEKSIAHSILLQIQFLD